MIFNVAGSAINTAYDVQDRTLLQAYDVNDNQLLSDIIPDPTPNSWYISQIGYDLDKPKIATLVNAANGTGYQVISADTGETIHQGTITDNKADFSIVNTAGNYYLASQNRYSYVFKIDADRTWKVCALPSLKFMEMARQDAWDVGGNTGYAWRDGHQFSFELNGLVMQYMSNPSYYNSLPWNVYKIAETEYENLRIQDCPNIIWLMKFAITRYYDWNTNNSINLHALIKGQIAYFLYIYPHISQYVSSAAYQALRDWCISIWNVTTCNKSWYEVSGGINHNLFTTQAKIGTVKGMLPPGYAIVPNLMMYEVATRDGLADAGDFMTAAENNMAWLINNVDLKDPANTKGQRMSEHITFHALSYMYSKYPEHCPAGTYDKIAELARVLVSRSNNLWDYTQYQTAGDLSGAASTIWNNAADQTTGLANNPGYVGIAASYYALASIITDNELKARLKELAVSHMAHAFGRNPFGRCFDYKAVEDFNNARLGWFSRLSGGYGHLDNVIGVLDGSPKESAYPYYPSAAPGYTEGWVAFNSAWNMALAYMQGEQHNGIDIFQ